MPDTAFWIAVTGLLLGLIGVAVTGRRRDWHGGLQGSAIGLFALASIIAGGPGLLSAALILTAVGIPAALQSHRAAALYGIAAMALAHLCYVLLFLALSQEALWDAFAAAPVPAIAVVALALSTEQWLIPHTGARHWRVRGGVALIAAMILAALTSPAVIPGAVLLGTAALLVSVGQFRVASPHPAIDAAARIAHLVGHALILWAILPA